MIDIYVCDNHLWDSLLFPYYSKHGKVSSKNINTVEYIGKDVISYMPQYGFYSSTMGYAPKSKHLVRYIRLLKSLTLSRIKIY